MSGTEQQPKPDAGQPNPETILNPNFRAVHGRLYIAATDDHLDTIEVVLDPKNRDIPFTLKPPTEKFISEPQRYNNAVWGLSKMERKATWDSVIQAHGFEYAMDEWNAQVRSSIDLTQIQSRKDLIKHYTGKESGHSPEEIRTTLYDIYCNGTSDVTEFVIEALKIPNVSEEDVKWLAKKLFGSDSAVVATKIMELEKSIENTGELATFELLFGISEQDRKVKFKRINDPLPDEVELLSKLKAGYDQLSPEEKAKIKAAQPPEPEPYTPPALKYGMRVIDEGTGKEYTIVNLYNHQERYGSGSSVNQVVLKSDEDFKELTENEFTTEVRKGNFTLIEEELLKPIEIEVGGKKIILEAGASNIQAKGEDSYYLSVDQKAIAVYDGMGGPGNGDEASQIARDSIASALQLLPSNPTTEEVEQALKVGYKNAKQEITKKETEDATKRGMGTTASVAVLHEQGGQLNLTILQMGDSRTYTVDNNNNFRQISVDYSLVNRDRAQNKITAEEATKINTQLDTFTDENSFDDITKPYFYDRHVMAAALEARGPEEPTILTRVVSPDLKYILITSDGVHDNLTTDEMASIFASNPNAEEGAYNLALLARHRGEDYVHRNDRSKSDDITAVVLKLNSETGAEPEGTEPTGAPVGAGDETPEPEAAEPEVIKVKEVDLKESENFIEDFKSVFSGETEEYSKKELIISPRQFVDEFIGTAAKISIKKGTGEIIINPKRPTVIRIKGLELESGVLLDLTIVNRGKSVRVKRNKTRGPEVKLPKGRLPDYEILDFNMNIKKFLNALSEAWKSDRVHVADGNIELDFNLK